MEGAEVLVLVVIGHMGEVEDGLRQIGGARLHGRNEVGGAQEEQERDQGLEGGADGGGAEGSGDGAEQKGDGQGDLQHAGAGIGDAEGGGWGEQVDGQCEEDGEPEKAGWVRGAGLADGGLRGWPEGRARGLQHAPGEQATEQGVEQEEGDEGGFAEQGEGGGAGAGAEVDPAEGFQERVDLEGPEGGGELANGADHAGLAVGVGGEQKAAGEVPEAGDDGRKQLPEQTWAVAGGGEGEEHEAHEGEGHHVGEEAEQKKAAEEPVGCLRAEKQRGEEEGAADAELEVEEAVPEVEIKEDGRGGDAPEEMGGVGVTGQNAGAKEVAQRGEGEGELGAEPELGGEGPGKDEGEERDGEGDGSVGDGVVLDQVGAVGEAEQVIAQKDALVDEVAEVAEAGGLGVGEDDGEVEQEEGAGGEGAAGRQPAGAGRKAEGHEFHDTGEVGAG